MVSGGRDFARDGFAPLLRLVDSSDLTVFAAGDGNG